MNMIVNQPKMMARPVMNRLKRMNILTVEIIREILTGPVLDDFYNYIKRQLGREILLEQEQETLLKEV
jgi:hypothetical protein